MEPIESAAEGVRLRIRATPRAKRTELMGIHGGVIRVRLSAPPVDGAANEELVAFLARIFGVSRSAIRLVAGQSSRSKVVDIIGLSLEEAAERLVAW